MRTKGDRTTRAGDSRMYVPTTTMTSCDRREDALIERLITVAAHDSRRAETYDVVVPIKPPLWLDLGSSRGLVQRDLKDFDHIFGVEASVTAFVEVVVGPQRDDAVPVI